MHAQRHPHFTQFLHWLTVALLALTVALVFGRDWIESRATGKLMLELHRSAGLVILLLATWRLTRLGKLCKGTHAHPLAALAARATHGALYLLLLVLPILGWAQTNAHGKPVALLGLIPLPTLLERNRDLADTLQTWHQNAAWLLFALIGVHVAAAMWHHYVVRDGVMHRMLPRRAVAGA